MLSFEHTHCNEQHGQSYPIFKLTKRESLMLVSDCIDHTSATKQHCKGGGHSPPPSDAQLMLVELHGEGHVPRFGGIYLDEYKREKPCFNLPKRESPMLVSDCIDHTSAMQAH